MAQIIDLGKFRFNWMGDWDVATEYERNDTVKYGGNVYVYTLNAASTSNLPTDTDFWALMLEGFNFRGEWDYEQSYELSDLVTYGGKVYLALRDTVNDNPATAEADWQVFVDGIQYEGDWSSATGYQVGDVVKYGGVVYIATSNSSNSIPSLSSLSWEVLVYGLEYKGTYDDATAYKLNDIVLYGGTSYIALQPGTGNEPTPGSYWAVFTNGFQWEGEWDTEVGYQTGDLTRYGGVVYVALQDSTATAPTDTAYWEVLTEGIAWKGTYSGSTTYNKNDIVTFGGSSWISLQNTTGNAPAVGAFWDVLASGTFPDYSAQAGKFLSNNGVAVTWVSDVTVDTLTANTQILAGANGENFDVNDGQLTMGLGVFADTSDTDSFLQLAVANYEPSSSADVIAYPNNGWDGDGWIDMGITGSTFNAATYGITGINDGYIFMSAPKVLTATISNKALTSNVATLTTSTAHNFRIGMPVTVTGVNATFNGTFTITGVPTTTTFTYAKTATNVASSSSTGTAVAGVTGAGNLVLATSGNGTANKIIFAAGGYTSGRTQMTITPDSSVKVNISTESTSPTTGAFQVVGGAGISGNLNVQGNVSIVGTISFGGSGTTTVIDTISSSDPILRSGANNTDDLFDLGVVGEYTVAVSNVVRTVSNKALTSNVATLTTTVAHTYSVGDVVVVTGVDTTFNGTVIVTGVTSTTFSYAKTATNVVSVASSGTTTKTRERRWRGEVRDASDGIVKLFHGSTVVPGNTVDFTNAGIAYSPLQTGAITATTVTSTLGTTHTTAGSTSAILNLTLSGSSNSFASSTISRASATLTGDFTASGNPTFSGNPAFTGTPVFTGGIRVQEMVEDVVDVALSSNVATLDYSLGNIFWTTSTPSANMTWNITNAPTDNGRVFTINVLVTQGATGYIPATFTINGSAASIKWAAGVAPTPTSSSGKYDIFTLTIVRRASAFVLLGSANLNF